jgi:hypothetical protein
MEPQHGHSRTISMDKNSSERALPCFETGKETLEAQLVVLPREERDRIYQQLIVIYPPLIEYQINAGARVIPIIEVIRKR